MGAGCFDVCTRCLGMKKKKWVSSVDGKTLAFQWWESRFEPHKPAIFFFLLLLLSSVEKLKYSYGMRSESDSEAVSI